LANFASQMMICYCLLSQVIVTSLFTELALRRTTWRWQAFIIL